MDLNLIKKLIRVVEKSEITEFSVQEGDLKLKISKNSADSNHTITTQPFATVQATPQQGNAIINEQPKTNPVEDSISDKLHEVRSPIVGTFYRAPAPDADPYIQLGDSVSDGSVLCIVEAMKLMNEIESDVSGKVVEVLVDDASPVEYNQPLFVIEKG
jgi:acetyl-CoA carboxylase biotin carboxyl carrier protein